MGKLICIGEGKLKFEKVKTEDYMHRGAEERKQEFEGTFYVYTDVDKIEEEFKKMKGSLEEMTIFSPLNGNMCYVEMKGYLQRVREISKPKVDLSSCQIYNFKLKYKEKYKKPQTRSGFHLSYWVPGESLLQSLEEIPSYLSVLTT